MGNKKKVELDKLDDIIILSEVGEPVFTGFTVRKEVDLEGVSRGFLEEEE